MMKNRKIRKVFKGKPTLELPPGGVALTKYEPAQ